MPFPQKLLKYLTCILERVLLESVQTLILLYGIQIISIQSLIKHIIKRLIITSSKVCRFTEKLIQPFLEDELYGEIINSIISIKDLTFKENHLDTFTQGIKIGVKLIIL